MELINFIEDHWTLITFFFAEISVLFVFVKSIHEGIKCSLRNDLLSIYDRCKDEKKITYYQLESMQHSYTLYKRLKGNSFVNDLMERVKEFEITE